MSPRSVLLTLTLLCAPVAEAAASVIYSFTQTAPMRSSHTGGTDAAVATALLVVSDEAYAQGFSLSYRNDVALPGTAALSMPWGLEALYIGVFNIHNPISTGLDSFMAPSRPGSGQISGMSLTAAAGGMLSGALYFNTSEHDVRFDFDGTAAASGAFNTDTPSAGRCNVTGSCSFAGVQTVTVPEPASLALFGVGLASLGLMRRRRG